VDGDKNADLREFSNFTIDPSVSTSLAPQMASTGWTNGTACNSTNGVGSQKGAHGIFPYGATMHFTDFHIEFMPTDIEVAGNTALNRYWPGGTANNISFENFQLCASCTGTSAYGIDIGPAASDISFRNFYVSATSPNYNVLNDNVTGNSCAGIAEQQQSEYVLGHGTIPTVKTACTGLTNVFAGPIQINGSTSGSVALSTPATGGQLNVNGPVNATTGFQVGGAAPNNHILLGNGTDYRRCFHPWRELQWSDQSERLIQLTILPRIAPGVRAALFSFRT
jgi:hypothetical protein